MFPHLKDNAENGEESKRSITYSSSRDHENMLDDKNELMFSKICS
jgi:hypothetical protein